MLKKHENLYWKKNCSSIWSGNKETEESKHEKEEVTKTVSVSKIVKEKESETETDEQGTVFVHEPKNTDDAKIILTDATLEKGKEDETTQKQEEVLLFFSKFLEGWASERVNILFCFVQVSVENPVIEEGQTETKHSQKEETEISKVLVDTAHVFLLIYVSLYLQN